MRRSNSNNKALRLDVSQRTDRKDLAGHVIKPATHLTVFSPLEAIHIHENRVISGIFQRISSSVRPGIASSTSCSN